MQDPAKLLLARFLDAYRSAPSRVLSPEQRELVVRAMEHLQRTPPAKDEQNRKSGFSPFMYPH
jgi:hypothetical protein